MPIITIHYAKTNLSRLIKKASAGEEIVIARGDKPVARLVALGELKGRRLPGSLKGKLHVGPEFFNAAATGGIGGLGVAASARVAGYSRFALVAFR